MARYTPTLMVIGVVRSVGTNGGYKKMIKEKMITYKQLSPWLKIAVVGMWIIVGLQALGFLAGFIAGYLGVV